MQRVTSLVSDESLYYPLWASFFPCIIAIFSLFTSKFSKYSCSKAKLDNLDTCLFKVNMIGFFPIDYNEYLMPWVFLIDHGVRVIYINDDSETKWFIATLSKGTGFHSMTMHKRGIWSFTFPLELQSYQSRVQQRRDFRDLVFLSYGEN